MYTRSPSAAGVELAQLLSPCFRSRSETTDAFSHTSLPVVRSTQYSTRVLSASTHPATNTLPLLTTGDEWPLPGSSSFHFTLSLALQVSAKPLSVTVPSNRGPRQPGQSSAATTPVTRNTAAAANNREYMRPFSGQGR